MTSKKIVFSLCTVLTLSSAGVAAKDINMAVGFSLAPYVIQENNTGMEADIVREALSVHGHKMLFRYPPLKQVPVLYQKGAVDAAMTVNENFGLNACLSDVVISYQNFAITLTKNKLRIDSIADLAGKSIVAFQNATTYLGDEYAKTVKAADYSEVENQLFQVNRLYNGRDQVVVSDKNIFIYYRNKAAKVDTSEAVSFHPIFPPSPYRVAFRDPSVCMEFNEGLKKIKESNRYNEIIDYYLNTKF